MLFFKACFSRTFLSNESPNGILSGITAVASAMNTEQLLSTSHNYLLRGDVKMLFGVYLISKILIAMPFVVCNASINVKRKKTQAFHLLLLSCIHEMHRIKFWHSNAKQLQCLRLFPCRRVQINTWVNTTCLLLKVKGQKYNWCFLVPKWTYACTCQTFWLSFLLRLKVVYHQTFYMSG